MAWLVVPVSVRSAAIAPDRLARKPVRYSPIIPGGKAFARRIDASVAPSGECADAFLCREAPG